MTKLDPGVADEIRQLAGRPSFQLLVAEVEKGRDNFFSSLARALGRRNPSAPPIDQRALDYQRGFWAGAIAAVTEYPRDAEKAWQRHLANEESEPE